MNSKVYFSDGTVKPITHCIFHSSYDIEFLTEDGHYHYIALISDINTYNHLIHRFYQIIPEENGQRAILVDIDRIELVYGKGEYA